MSGGIASTVFLHDPHHLQKMIELNLSTEPSKHITSTNCTLYKSCMSTDLRPSAETRKNIIAIAWLMCTQIRDLRASSERTWVHFQVTCMDLCLPMDCTGLWITGAWLSVQGHEPWGGMYPALRPWILTEVWSTVSCGAQLHYNSGA